jgi:hypothetical protein
MNRAPQRQLQAALGVLLVAVLAGGCGGGTTKTSNAASPRAANPASVDASQSSDAPASAGSNTDDGACNLLTEADVSTAMNQPMKVSGGAADAICSYSATADPSVLLYVQSFNTPTEMAVDTQLEAGSEHVDGLGDDAFWLDALDLLYVRTGDRAFAVTSPSLGNLSGDPQVTKTAMVDLANIVLNKL